MSSPSDVLKLLQDALDAQPTIVGQPNDDDLLALKEKLLNVLQTITYYDRADGIVSTMSLASSNPTQHIRPITTKTHFLSSKALACGMTRLPKTQQW